MWEKINAFNDTAQVEPHTLDLYNLLNCLSQRQSMPHFSIIFFLSLKDYASLQSKYMDTLQNNVVILSSVGGLKELTLKMEWRISFVPENKNKALFVVLFVVAGNPWNFQGRFNEWNTIFLTGFFEVIFSKGYVYTPFSVMCILLWFI